MNRPHRSLAAQRISTTTIAVLLVILLGAFALRVTQLEREQVSGDEAFSAELATYSVPHLVQHLIELKEPHPLGSFIAEGIALTLFGHNEYGARFLSVIAGMAAVALMVPFMRVLLRPAGIDPRAINRVAMVAALLMALNPLAIWHSRWGRMYAISLALTLASTILALLITQRRAARHNTRLATVIYLAVTWLAMNTHYYAAYILVVQNLFIVGRGLLQPRYRASLLHWIGTQAALVMLCAPWLWLARGTLTGYVGNGSSPTFAELWIKSLSVFFVGEVSPEKATIAAWVAGALALLGAVRLLSPSRTRGIAVLLLMYGGVPPLLTWVGSLSRPIFMERYLIAALPGFVGLLALAVVPVSGVRLPQLRRLSYGIGAVAALAIAVSVLPALRDYFQHVAEARSYWRALAQTFYQFDGNLPADQYRVAINYPDPGLSFYYRIEPQRVVLPVLPNDVANTEQRVRAFVAADVRRVAFEPHPSGFDNQGIAEAVLAQHFNKLYTVSTELGQTVDIYARVPASELTPINTTFTNHLTLSSARVIPDLKGRLIEVHLTWSADPTALTQLSGQEHIFVHLVRIGGPAEQVAQIDPAFDPRLTDGRITSFGLPLPSQLEPGDYMVRIGLYDPAQPGAPRIYTIEGRDAIELPTGHLE